MKALISDRLKCFLDDEAEEEQKKKKNILVNKDKKKELESVETPPDLGEIRSAGTS